MTDVMEQPTSSCPLTCENLKKKDSNDVFVTGKWAGMGEWKCPSVAAREGTCKTASSTKKKVGEEITAVQMGDTVLLGCPPQSMVQLSDLRHHLSKFSKCRATKVTIDLNGAMLTGGCLRCSIHLSPLTIKNGILDVDEINSIKNLVLEQIQIQGRDQPMKIVSSSVKFAGCGVSGSGALVLLKGTDVTMKQCDVQGGLRDGVVVSDVGTTLHAKRCLFSKCKRMGVLIVNGGCGYLTECEVSDNRECDGVRVKDPGSRLEAKLCVFQRNFAAGVLGCNGGRIDLVKCRLTESKELSGAEIHDKGTRGSFRYCDFNGNSESGMVVHSGGRVKLLGCTCQMSVDRCGLEVAGKGSQVEAGECTFADNKLSGVRAVGSSSVTLNDCRVEGSNRGLEVADRGSVGTIVRCLIRSVGGVGVVAEKEALMSLRDCEIRGSKSAHDLEVRGEGTEVWLARVHSKKVSNHKELDLFVEPGGRVIS